MTMRGMPIIYLPPYGTPFYWGDEETGKLAAAVNALYAPYRGEDTPLTDEQLILVSAYLAYAINAPCWRVTPENAPRLAHLRTAVETLPDREAVWKWLDAALELGIDIL